MKNRFQLFSFLLTLGIVLGLIAFGGSLQAQQTPPSSQQSAPDTQQPSQQQPSAPSPDQPGKQTQAPEQQTPGQQTQTPDQQPSTQPSQPSGQSAQPSGSTDATGVQTFTGTVVKQGDKYMLQDAASGTTYDIDHQDEVKKFEGKKVRVHGTLDASTKTIHVQ